MGWKFNPFTGALDQTGSGGGSSVIEGEVDTYNDLPLDGSAALNSSWLVRTASGSWFTGGSKPAGIYVRVNTAGSSRDNDYVYAGLLPSAFSDSELKIYDQGDSTKTAQFQLSGIATGQNRVVSLPDKNITLDDSGDSRTPTAHAASHAAGIKASYKDQVGGMTEDAFIRANTAGTAGNSIVLAFDGVDDIDTVLGAWNSANPSNQATLVSGDGAQVPDNGEQIALSGGVAGGSDPFKNINQNLGTDDEVEFAKLSIARTEDNTGQDSAAKLLSTQNTEAGDFNWRGRIMNGAENRTFLMGCYLGEAGLGAHSWSSAKNEEGAAWADFLINPDGAADVYIGCAGWDKDTAILKVGNSDGKVTIADQSDPTKRVDLDVSGVTTETTRTLEIPDASGTLALTSDIPANTIASTLIDAKGDLIVGTAADTVARLPVGATNGHVLTVDSAEASGMKWAAASGGVSAVGASAADILSVSGSDLVADDPNADRLVFYDDSASKLTHLSLGSNALSIDGTTLKIQPLFPVEPISRGATYIPYIGAAANGNSSGALNTGPGYVIFAPVYIRKSANYTTFSCIVTSAGAASSLGKMALYTIKTTDATPDALVCASGTFATDSTGIKQPTMASTFVSEGWYYMALATNSTTNVLFYGDTMPLLRGVFSGAAFNTAPALFDYSSKLYADLWPDPWNGTNNTFRNAFYPITSLT